MDKQGIVQQQKTTTLAFTPVCGSVLQRKCACGQHTVAGGECAGCRKKRLGLQRQATDQTEPATAPAIVREVLRSPGQPLDVGTRAFIEPRFGHDFSRVQVHTDAPKQIQTKLTINQPGDKYEQEADRVAEQVMRMPEQDCQRQADMKIDELPQTKPLVQRQISKGMGGGEAPLIVHEVLHSPGQPLDAETRTFMETRFGHDFSTVRIHTDSKAAHSAADIQAAAYTIGQDIVFGADQYRTGTTIGRKLLAHELVHVLQQPVNSTLLLRDDEEIIHGEGQIQEMGNIRFVGSAVTLESDLTSSVTGHLSINWALSGSGGNLLRRGTFFNGGVVTGSLLTGGLYTLRMAGSISVSENNLIFNDAFNGIAVAAEWLLQPQEDDDAAAELIGVPTVRPISNPLTTPDRSDWNIVVQDITRSRSDSVQVGLVVSWTKSSSATTGYGGSLELGEGVQISRSSGSAVTFADGATLFTLFRFGISTMEIGDVQIEP